MKTEFRIGTVLIPWETVLMTADPIATLGYRPFVLKLYRVTIWTLIFSELVIIRINIFEILEGTWYAGVFKLLLASTIPMSIFFRLIIYVRPQVHSLYELYSDKLVRKHGKKSLEYMFDDVVLVTKSTISPRFSGGFYLHFKSGQKLLLLAALTDNFKILDQLKIAKPELFKDKSIQKFFETTRLVSVSWKRMAEKLTNWKLLMAKWVLLPFVYSIIGYSIGLQWAPEGQEKLNFLYMFSGLLLLNGGLSVFVNHFEEKLVIAQLIRENKAGELNRDLVFEKKVNIGSLSLFLFISLTLNYFLLFRIF